MSTKMELLNPISMLQQKMYFLVSTKISINKNDGPRVKILRAVVPYEPGSSFQGMVAET